ncbi:hypothetical protein NXY55_10145 [Aeromonas veronii]|nr:hypothetical protein [Aeromonas veronii]
MQSIMTYGFEFLIQSLIANRWHVFRHAVLSTHSTGEIKMTAYILTGVFGAALYVLGYVKGRMDQKKEQFNFVSNYVGEKK